MAVSAPCTVALISLLIPFMGNSQIDIPIRHWAREKGRRGETERLWERRTDTRTPTLTRVHLTGLSAITPSVAPVISLRRACVIVTAVYRSYHNGA